MEDEKPKERPRPHFWRWGDPVTVRNPIREQWEAAQKEKARKKLEAFLRRQANNGTDKP